MNWCYPPNTSSTSPLKTIEPPSITCDHHQRNTKDPPHARTQAWPHHHRVLSTPPETIAPNTLRYTIARLPGGDKRKSWRKKERKASKLTPHIICTSKSFLCFVCHPSPTAPSSTPPSYGVAPSLPKSQSHVEKGQQHILPTLVVPRRWSKF